MDRFLAARGGISRGEARRTLDRGGVWLDGKRCKTASRPVRAGQRIRAVFEEAGRSPEAAAPALQVLHEDDWVLAVSKAAGVPSQATPAGDVGTLPWQVARHLGRKISEIATVHRLDRETSGVVVFGKVPAATRALAAAFREGTARKTYWAVVAGRLEGKGTLDAPLGPVPGKRGVHTVRGDGVPARTEWEAVATLGEASLVRLHPKTGRTHQLRVHLAHLGHPIVGDVRYGGPRQAGPIAPTRLLLHASALEVPHPSGVVLSLEAPFPADFSAAVDFFSLERPA